jgi:class 3 adenylate cyclase
MEPRIQFAKTADGVNIAYCVMGEGPGVMRIPTPPWSHVQREWDTFPYFLFVKPLAESCRIAWYDSRGSGLSDRDARDFSMSAMVRDLEAVLSRVGRAKLALCAPGDGVPIAVTYAAAHPERVSHLVLVDGYTKFEEYFESPVHQLEAAIREKDWVLYTDTLAQVLFGLDDPDLQRRLAEQLRASAEPEALQAAYTAMVEWDTSNLLRSIAVPSLVIHNQRNRFLRVHAGQRLAASIPNSRLLVVDDMTYEHVPRLIAEFLGLPVAPAGVGLDLPSGLVTILFTDMVGSTSMMRRLGDDKGRAVLRQHERIVREALKAHGGTEVKTMGDGFMACLSSATRALECAIAMQRAFAEHNAALLRQAQDAHTEPVEVRVRVGLNAGEPIAEDEDLFGTAVILAARIAAKAEGGEILASDVVRQLVAGKGFLFSDRGDVVLRGFEDPVRLYEVRWEA